MSKLQDVILLQPNFKIGFGEFTGYWLPYSVGCLWSFAMENSKYIDNFNLVDLIFRRENPDKLVDRISNLDAAFFSCYMWNWEYTKVVAAKIKRKFPKCKIIFGGPQVTHRPSDKMFFLHHPYVDSIVLGEGEEAFVEILASLNDGKDLDKIYRGNRLVDLDIPSPYLLGVFDKIIEENPGVFWNGTLETNRGCPFACTFCDWGSLTYAKIKKFPEPKVFQELEWMALNKMDYVTIADANFGVFYDRDMAFTKKLVELQNTYGHPKVVDATWYKNSSEKVLEIVKLFISSGFNRGLTLSVQSMDENVLETIKRRNMEMSKLKLIFDQCIKENIPSYTELILGLPNETYETWKRGICEVIEVGQHNAIESWLAQLLENAELNQPEQREEHGITTIVVENYITGHEEEDNIPEKVELVTGTKTMPQDDFIKSWLYSWMVNNFHNYGWSQAITRFLRKHKNYSYEYCYDLLFDRIRSDDGVVRRLYEETKQQITEYLETGETSGSSGHTLMWDSQKHFHTNREEIINFVESVFTEEFCDINSDMMKELLDFQRHFTTEYGVSYPYQKTFNYNFHDYIADSEVGLHNSTHTHVIDISERVESLDEYLNRLYFRRRQGWGKSKITILAP